MTTPTTSHPAALASRQHRLLVALMAVAVVAAGSAMMGCATGGDSSDQAPEHTERPAVQLADSDIIPVADSPTCGAEDAWVTVVVFADFQCPFCAQLAATLDEVLDYYDERMVRLVFKHHPLDQHDGAEPAARAAEAAREQGNFWQMHDALFDALADLRGDDPRQAVFDIAGELQLDEQQFRRDFDSDEIAERIDEDRRLAEQLNLDGAPAVFVNGGYISGARPADVYHAAIQNVYDVLEQAVLEGEIEREEVYRSSVETLFDHTSPDQSPAGPTATPIVELPVEHQRPDTADPDDALVNIGAFVDLNEDSSLQLLDQLEELTGGDDRLRVSFFHLLDERDETAELAHRLLEGADTGEQIEALISWLGDEDNHWRDDPDALRSFAGDHDIEPANEDTLAEQIEGDVETATQFEVYGTPTFFINGIRFAGVPDRESVREVVDEQLALAMRVGDIRGLSGQELYEEMVQGNRRRGADPGF